VSVTVSLNKYFEDGEYPVTSVGTTTAGEVSQASGPLLVGKMYLLNFIAVASAYRLPLAGFVVALGSRELFLLNRMRMRDPMDEIWLLLKKLKKIEEKKTGPEKELKKYKKLIDELEDRITGDERLYEDIEDGQDGSEWGSATYGTKLKKEISRKKLRLAELKNLHRYYELKVEKLDDEIDDIKKEIERLQRQTLPPT
jgi:septal ring factor EnvC (AmiA/AmiB activator)